MTFAELQNYKRQIVEEQMGWIRDVKKVTGPELEAYEAGLTAGMAQIIRTLKLHGVIGSQFS